MSPRCAKAARCPGSSRPMTTGCTSSSSAARGRVRVRSSRNGSPERSGRAIGLTVPDLVGIEVDGSLGDAEPDGEIHDLVRASDGLNLGHGLPAGCARLQPGRGHDRCADRSRRSRPTPCGSMRCHEPGPDGPEPEPARLAWTPVADRPRRRALHPPHLARPGRPRPPAVRADPRPRPAAVRRARSKRPTSGTPSRIDGPLLVALVDALPDAWLPARCRPSATRTRQRAAYVRYLLRRLEAPRDALSRRPNVPAARRSVFQYAIVRVVPRVERGECLNVGVDPAVPAAAVPRRPDPPRRATAGGVRAGPRSRADPATAPRGDRAGRRGRSVGRADRRGSA